jgi:aromatic ring hydroxylase
MGVRTGKEYLASLHDERHVIYDGERIKAVTDEPGMRNTARAVAQFYDFQTRPENSELMTYRAPNGERAGMAFREARSKDELRQRAAAYAAWAEITCGFMGRSPDYMNTLLATLSSISSTLADIDRSLGNRARDLYVEARDRDLCYTHTFAEPFKVVPAPPREPSPSCRVVCETAEGLIISGARSLATLAPFANMSFDLPGGAAYERGGVPYLCGFVTPIAAPGLRWVCRDKFGGDRSHAQSPLASRVDEMDCVALFDDCLVPWRCVYLFAPLSTEMPQMTFIMSGLQHHVLVRSIAKTRFILGLAHLIAESSKVNRFINIQERLGEMVCWLRTLEAFAVAAVADAVIDPASQTYHPNPQTTEIACIWSAQMYPRMVSHILDIGGSRHVTATQHRTIEMLGDVAEKYFRGGSDDIPDARENIALFRLAWEVAGSEWGARQDLYERFHFGDATLRRVEGYLRFDRSQVIAMVRRILTLPPSLDEVFPVGTHNNGGSNG